MSSDIVTMPKKTGKDGIIMLISELQRMGILDTEGNIILQHKREEELHSTKKLSLIMKNLYKRKEIVLLSDFQVETQRNIGSYHRDFT